MMAYASWSVVFGEQPSAAKWNILGTNDASFNNGTGIANLELGSGKTSLKNDYKFSVYRTTAYSATASAATELPFDTKAFDTSTNIDVVTNKGRFTAPVAGFYFFSASVAFSSTNNRWIIAYLYKNGSQAIIGEGNLNAAGAINSGNLVSGLLSLAANDFVEVYYFNNNADALAGGSTGSQFSGFLVSQT
jgi:hypothetical protein